MRAREALLEKRINSASKFHTFAWLVIAENNCLKGKEITVSHDKVTDFEH